jgi:hypothetical protein
MSPPPVRITRLTVAIGVAQVLAWATSYYIPATMAGAAAESLGTSRTVLLGGFSWALLITGLCSPHAGRWIERAGGRRVLATSTVVMAAGSLLLAASNGLVLWYIGWSVLGVGMSLGLYDAAFATIGQLLGTAARPSIVGVTLIAGFASTLAWPGGTYLTAHLGWRMTAVLYAAIQLLMILPIVLAFVPRASPAQATTAQARTAARPGGIRFALLAVYFTSRAAITALISVHLLVLLARFGLSAEQGAGIAALIGPAQVGSRMLDWKFGRGLSPLASAILGAALLPISIAVLLGGVAPIVFAITYGMSNGILTISRGTLPLHVFGPGGYASLLGRLAMPGLIAQAVTPTLIGPVVDSWPAGWIFAGIGVGGLIATAALLGLRRAA